MQFSRCIVAARPSSASRSSITRKPASLLRKIARSSSASSPLAERSTSWRCSTRRPLENSDVVEVTASSARALVRPKTNAMKTALKLRTEFLHNRFEAGVVADRIVSRIKPDQVGTRTVRLFREFLQRGKGAVALVQDNVDLRRGLKHIRPLKRILRHRKNFECALRLPQGTIMIAEIGKRERQCDSRIWRFGH